MNEGVRAMAKLKLLHIFKSYRAGNTNVEALKGISLAFRESEFVSILGPSGCGKTTLLNVIGGLDRYEQGDLFLDNLSTKLFRDRDWDAYRNHSIGFVFQNYNLISHQSVLHNVEISMTLAGVSVRERRRRAKEALAAVNLSDQIKKKPNQLSGGQMQRVAIARALVNNPDIILADEPTGALDSQTSVQIMEILKEIAKTRLVIMVTHNNEMAEAYSNRIVRLLDGVIQSDTNPVPMEEAAAPEPGTNGVKKAKLTKTSMSLWTATSLSFKNLLTKKGRTIITAMAGSIGIIGVALVLALSNGLAAYIDSMQSEALSGFPITVTTGEQMIDFNAQQQEYQQREKDNAAAEKFRTDDQLVRYDSEANTTRHMNVLTQDYLDYVGKMQTELPDTVNNISYNRDVDINLLAKGDDTVVKYNTTAPSGMRVIVGNGNEVDLYWQEMPNNEAFILSLYDLIGTGSRFPTAKNEVALVVDEYNRIDEALFQKLGIVKETEAYHWQDFIGKTFLKVIPNNDFYTKLPDGNFAPSTADQYENLYSGKEGTSLTITGILRIKEGAASSYLNPGIAYTTALTDYIVADAKQSELAVAQEKADHDLILNTPFKDEAAKEECMKSVGADTSPTGVNIYPKDFDSKERVKEYLDQYNQGKDNAAQVVYSDLAETITSMIGTLLNTITYVLVGFAAISLVVSSIMIGIITYVSVIERTKEIGILRSVGGRKKDIARVFNAETLIIGFVAGLIGVLISYLLTFPINSIIANLVDIQGIANLAVPAAVILIAGSMILTLIAGLVPARIAAKKDPVVALRTE